MQPYTEQELIEARESAINAIEKFIRMAKTNHDNTEDPAERSQLKMTIAHADLAFDALVHRDVEDYFETIESCEPHQRSVTNDRLIDMLRPACDPNVTRVEFLDIWV